MSWKTVVFAACAVLACMSAKADYTYLEEGSVVTVDAAANVASTVYYANGSATLKPTGTVAEGVFSFLPSINIPAGKTVTLDVSELTDCTQIAFGGSLRGNGTLALGAGVTHLRFGSTVDWDNILHLAAFETPVTFAEAGGKVVFHDGVSLLRWPASYEVSDDAVIALFGADLITTDSFALTNYDVLIAERNCFPAGCAFTVPTGRTLYYRPSSIKSPTATSLGMRQWSGQSDWEHTFDTVLAGGRLCPQLRTKGCVVRGDLSGTGRVFLFGDGGEMSFVGKIDFSEPVNISILTSTDSVAYTFDLAEGSDLSGANLALCRAKTSRVTVKTNGRDYSIPSVGGDVAAGKVNGELAVAGGGSLTVGLVSNEVTFVAADAAANAISVGAVTAGAKLSVTPGVTLGLPDGLQTSLACVAGDVAGPWSVIGGTTSAAVLDLTFPSSGAALVVGGKTEFVSRLSDVATLTVSDGASVRVALGADTALVMQGGSFEEILPSTWRNKVALWTDAGVASSFVSAKDHAKGLSGITQKQLDALAVNQVYEWRDWRGGNYAKSIRVNKYYSSCSSFSALLFPYVDDAATVFPFVRWPANSKTRTAFCNPGTSTVTPISSKCVLSVFSAALGGGIALMAETNSKLERTGKTAADGIVKNATGLSIATNGVAVADPTATGFTGGWQIVRVVSEDALDLQGVANQKSWNEANDNGGQQYAEILVFGTEPTAEEIVAAERYLSEKWGLPVAKTAGSARTVNVSGAGSVKFLDDAPVTFGTAGYYAGAVDLAGGRLEIQSGRLPALAADIPSANRLLWVDASLDGAVHYGTDPDKPDEVDYVNSRDNAGLLTASGSYYVTSPIAEDGTVDRRARFTDGWLRLADGYDDGVGNMLCLKQLPYTVTRGYAAEDKLKQFDNVVSAFFALDTSDRGGGSYCLSQVNASSGDFVGRSIKSNEKIVNSGSDAPTFDAWLDGVAKNPTTDTMTGKPEILSLGVASESAKAAAIVKLFGNPHVGTYANGNETLGEWMLFSAAVSTETREAIESYLMKKWCGRIRDGFYEPRDMTLTGAGVVSVSSLAALPKLGASFSGSVELATTTSLDFTVTPEGTVEGRIVLPGQTLTFKEKVLTINVSSARLRAGTYSLVSAGSLDPDVSFSLGTVTGATAGSYRLVRTATGVDLVVDKAGFILLFR